MSEDGIRRSDLLEMVDELRAALRDIGDEPMPQAQLVTDTRERLRYIARLTEQAASQTLNAVEDIGDMLRTPGMKFWNASRPNTPKPASDSPRSSRRKPSRTWSARL
jgi:hypothetical protein